MLNRPNRSFRSERESANGTAVAEEVVVEELPKKASNMESEGLRCIEDSQVSDILSDVTHTVYSSENGETETSQNLMEGANGGPAQTGLNLCQVDEQVVPNQQQIEDDSEVAVEAIEEEASREDKTVMNERHGGSVEAQVEQEKAATPSGDVETPAKLGVLDTVGIGNGDNKDTVITEKDETTSLDAVTSKVRENDVEEKVEQDISEVSSCLIDSTEQTKQVPDDMNEEIAGKDSGSRDTVKEDKEQAAELGGVFKDDEIPAEVNNMQPETSEQTLIEPKQDAAEKTLPSEYRMVEGAESMEEANKGDTAQEESNANQSVNEDKKEDVKEEIKENKVIGEWVDILGNELLRKKVIIEGKGEESRPKPGNEVTLIVNGTLENGTPLQEEKLNFILDDREVIQAFDLCVALMELGEKAIIYTDSKYAYGPFGCNETIPIVPKNCNITYMVELISVKEGPNKETMPDQARIDIADKKRLRGNNLYAIGDYGSAIDSYKRALKFLEGSASEEVIEMKVKCHNNLSASQIKVNAYQAALQSCNTVLNLRNRNVKALFRKAKCQEALGDHEEALKCLKQASMLDPNNKMIHGELIRLSKCVQKNKQKESDMYKRMVGGLRKDGSDEGDIEENSFPYKLMIGTLIAAGIGIVAGFLYNRH